MNHLEICKLAYLYGMLIRQYDDQSESDSVRALVLEKDTLEACSKLMRAAAFLPGDSGVLRPQYKIYYSAGYDGLRFYAVFDLHETRELPQVKVNPV